MTYLDKGEQLIEVTADEIRMLGKLPVEVEVLGFQTLQEARGFQIYGAAKKTRYQSPPVVYVHIRSGWAVKVCDDRQPLTIEKFYDFMSRWRDLAGKELNGLSDAALQNWPNHFV
jgi:hypothetical protein